MEQSHKANLKLLKYLYNYASSQYSHEQANCNYWYLCISEC